MNVLALLPGFVRFRSALQAIIYLSTCRLEIV